MKIRPRIILAGAILLGSVLPVKAQNILTHMGVPPEDHVILQTLGVLGQCDALGLARYEFRTRMFMDGRVTSDFSIPEGRVLVVTDFDWQYKHPQGASKAGELTIMRLNITEGSGFNSDYYRVLDSAIILGPEGSGGTSENLTSGILVASGSQLCMDVTPGSNGPPSGIQHAIIRGYLLDLPNEPTLPIRKIPIP